MDYFGEFLDSKTVRLFLNSNADQSNSKSISIRDGDTLDNIMHLASAKLGIEVQTLFTEVGEKITDPTYINDGDNIICSKDNKFRKQSSKSRFPYVQGYEIVQILGKGAFGRVYKAKRLLSNDFVALKFLSKAHIHKPKDVARIFSEMVCLQAIQHENVVKFYGNIDTSTDTILVMEYAGGGDLKEFMKHYGGRLSEIDAGKIFREMTLGVSYFHQHNIIHCDLKLENILLSEDGHVKITDFGLSSFLAAGRTTKSTCGSLAYLPPEVLEKKGCEGPPRDIWAMGIILYQMIYGNFPWPSITVQELESNVLYSDVVFPTDIPVSQKCKSLISLILNKDPDKRITTAQILVNAWLKDAANSSEGVETMRDESILPSASAIIDKLNNKHKDTSPSQSPVTTAATATSTSMNKSLSLHPSRLPPLTPLTPSVLHPIIEEWLTRKRKLLKPVVTPIKPPLLQTITFHNNPPLFLQKRSAYLYDSPVPSPSNKSLSSVRRSRSSSTASERPKSHSLTCRERSCNFPSLRDNETIDLKRVSMPEYIPQQTSARFPNFKNSGSINSGIGNSNSNSSYNKPSGRRKVRQTQQQDTRTPPRSPKPSKYIPSAPPIFGPPV